MIDEAKHIKELTSLGLSENEAKTYITLLTKNSMTVGEIAKISGVPRPKLYEILTKLIE
ncbi:TrmB family transcriptional regulator, partial [bacterium]